MSNSVKRKESLRSLGESVVQFKEGGETDVLKEGVIEIDVLKEGVIEKLETFP